MFLAMSGKLMITGKSPRHLGQEWAKDSQTEVILRVTPAVDYATCNPILTPLVLGRATKYINIQYFNLLRFTYSAVFSESFEEGKQLSWSLTYPQNGFLPCLELLAQGGY